MLAIRVLLRTCIWKVSRQLAVSRAELPSTSWDGFAGQLQRVRQAHPHRAKVVRVLGNTGISFLQCPSLYIYECMCGLQNFLYQTYFLIRLYMEVLKIFMKNVFYEKPMLEFQYFLPQINLPVHSLFFLNYSCTYRHALLYYNAEICTYYYLFNLHSSDTKKLFPFEGKKKCQIIFFFSLDSFHLFAPNLVIISK